MQGACLEFKIIKGHEAERAVAHVMDENTRLSSQVDGMKAEINALRKDKAWLEEQNAILVKMVPRRSERVSARELGTTGRAVKMENVDG